MARSSIGTRHGWGGKRSRVGHNGGAPFSLPMSVRYARMAKILHRDRRAIFEDATLTQDEKKKIVDALDALLELLLPFFPSREQAKLTGT